MVIKMRASTLLQGTGVYTFRGLTYNAGFKYQLHVKGFYKIIMNSKIKS